LPRRQLPAIGPGLRILRLRRQVMYGITDITTFVLGTIFIVLLPGPNSVFVLSAATMQGVAAGYRAAAGVFVGDAILMLLASAGAASVLYTNPTLFVVLKYAGAAYLTWIGVGLLRQAWHGWQHDTKQSAAAPASPIDAPREAPLEDLVVDQTAAPPPTLSPKSSSASLPTRSNIAKTQPEPKQITKPKTKTKAKANSRPKPKPPFRGALLISLLNPKAIFFFISFFVQFVDPQYAYPVLTFLLLGVIVQICSVSYLAALIHGGAHLARRMGQHPRLNALGAVLVGGIFIWFGLKLAQASL